MSVLKEHYEISEDWEGKKYVGLTFDWDYEKQRVHVSMPWYVDHALIFFKHGTPWLAQDQPYQHSVSIYGACRQFAVAPDGTELPNKDSKTFLQQVTVTFLHYTRSVDSMMLVALSTLASE